MREQFSGYFPLSEDVANAVWARGIIAFDTNVLLNLYRFNSSTRQSLLSVIAALKSQVWLPEQVASEFHRNRIETIRTQQKTIEALSATLSELARKVDGQLRAHSRNPVLDVETLTTRLGEAFASCEKALNQAKLSFETDYGISPQDDPILAEVGNLFGGRVGRAYEPERLASLTLEAEDRYSQKIPPGYKDDRKLDGRSYGDYILWRQLLDEAKQRELPAILVTDDEKEDWWWNSEGQTLGPRPELRQEFLAETGHEVILYRSPTFLREASARGIVSVESESVEDADRLLSHDDQVRDATKLREMLARQNELTVRLRAAEADQVETMRFLEANRTKFNRGKMSKEERVLWEKLNSIERAQFDRFRQLSRVDTPEAREELERELASLEARRKPFETVLGSTSKLEDNASGFESRSMQRQAELAAAAARDRINSLRAELHAELAAYERAVDDMRDRGTPVVGE